MARNEASRSLSRPRTASEETRRIRTTFKLPNAAPFPSDARSMPSSSDRQRPRELNETPTSLTECAPRPPCARAGTIEVWPALRQNQTSSASRSQLLREGDSSGQRDRQRGRSRARSGGAADIIARPTPSAPKRDINHVLRRLKRSTDGRIRIRDEQVALLVAKNWAEVTADLKKVIYMEKLLRDTMRGLYPHIPDDEIASAKVYLTAEERHAAYPYAYDRAGGPYFDWARSCREQEDLHEESDLSMPQALTGQEDFERPRNTVEDSEALYHPTGRFIAQSRASPVRVQGPSSRPESVSGNNASASAGHLSVRISPPTSNTFRLSPLNLQDEVETKIKAEKQESHRTSQKSRASRPDMAALDPEELFIQDRNSFNESVNSRGQRDAVLHELKLLKKEVMKADDKRRALVKLAYEQTKEYLIQGEENNRLRMERIDLLRELGRGDRSDVAGPISETALTSQSRTAELVEFCAAVEDAQNDSTSLAKNPAAGGNKQKHLEAPDQSSVGPKSQPKSQLPRTGAVFMSGALTPGKTDSDVDSCESSSANPSPSLFDMETDPSSSSEEESSDSESAASGSSSPPRNRHDNDEPIIQEVQNNSTTRTGTDEEHARDTTVPSEHGIQALCKARRPCSNNTAGSNEILDQHSTAPRTKRKAEGDGSMPATAATSSRGKILTAPLGGTEHAQRLGEQSIKRQKTSNARLSANFASGGIVRGATTSRQEGSNAQRTMANEDFGRLSKNQRKKIRQAADVRDRKRRRRMLWTNILKSNQSGSGTARSGKVIRDGILSSQSTQGRFANTMLDKRHRGRQISKSLTRVGVVSPGTLSHTLDSGPSTKATTISQAPLLPVKNRSHSNATRINRAKAEILGCFEKLDKGFVLDILDKVPTSILERPTGVKEACDLVQAFYDGHIASGDSTT